MAGSLISNRLLVNGTGTVTPTYVARKPYRLTFSLAQHFHRGETVAIANFIVDPGPPTYDYGVFTIAFGAGTEWITHQIGGTFNGATASASWKRTDPSTSRARGSGTVPHRAVPGAIHYLYASPIDALGNVDAYTYVDTVVPVNGLHPYTRDMYAGIAWQGNDAAPWVDGVLVPDTGNRLSALDSLPPVLSR